MSATSFNSQSRTLPMARDFADVTTVELRLYVTGRSPQTRRAIENLYAICEEGLNSPSVIEVIDVLESPSLADQEKILATPTLVKRAPAPVRKTIGDLSLRDKVLVGLHLEQLSENEVDT